MKEVITVPFSKKKEAVALGAEFDITDRQWYITDNTELENHETLRHLADVEVQEIAIELPEEDQPLTGKEVPIEGETEENDETFSDWSAILDSRDSLKIAMTLRNHTPLYSSAASDVYKRQILDSRDSLKIAMTLRNHKVPAEENDRIRMLEILNLRTPGNYPFTYDGMINLSESFEKAYPPENIQALAMKLTSPGNYLMRIRNSELSAEEKALMYFVLPFGAE